eukprot:m.57531 g.57531  ORF g.57531 m.57531 type:complete len:84 (+) comp7830_c2_seq2:1597-1848(+)
MYIFLFLLFLFLWEFTIVFLGRERRKIHTRALGRDIIIIHKQISKPITEFVVVSHFNLLKRRKKLQQELEEFEEEGEDEDEGR